MQKKNSEVNISFVVSNPNKDKKSEVQKKTSSFRSLLGFFYAYGDVFLRVLVCAVLVGIVGRAVLGGIENSMAPGMGVSPIEGMFIKLMEAVSLIVAYVVPGMIAFIVFNIVAHKKITGKMPEIFPTNVKMSLLFGGILGVGFGGYYYYAFSKFLRFGLFNVGLVRTSIQVGVLVFLVVFFMSVALLNLCEIGRKPRNIEKK